ncbi:hypothetical protein [Candidatus Enterococcus ferrettii]|uniref:Uncharacterized protein n=1 Tax=Candidatus Enterococcus ferrettii TaxID=2815324 RepID=A0ABV0EWC6_9ENTE|nr:hypothetical protein [Enterococcus sp. 665A]MBO1340333.1 hypothetical protein [Enterococcus sp. 665A]
MVYPVFDKEESECAYCGKNLFDENGFSTQSYLTVRDNFMIIKFFQFEDGCDNMFCDSDCLARYLSAEEITIETT